MVVIGPIGKEEWYTMRALRESIKEMQERDRVGLDVPIKIEQDLLKWYKSNISVSSADSIGSVAASLRAA